MLERLLQIEGVDFGVDAVESPEGGDDDFARGQRGYESDTDLPVEAKRTDDGSMKCPTEATTLS